MVRLVGQNVGMKPCILEDKTGNWWDFEDLSAPYEDFDRVHKLTQRELRPHARSYFERAEAHATDYGIRG